MPQNIHPTAIIENGAQIGSNVKIGPYCIIGADVHLANNITLKSHVNIEGLTHIGENTTVFPFTSLGSAPQDLKYNGEKTELIIGANNTIREHVTMNPGTVQGVNKTVIGDNCLFMVGCHVAHDCVVGNNVIMANNAVIAGHVEIGDFAIIGGMSAVHQFIRIGTHAVIGGMSGVDSNVIPYGRVKGERAFLAGLNLIGLERRGFDKGQIKQLQKAFKQLFIDEGTFEQRLEMLSVDFKQDDLIMSIIEFASTKSRFPICRPQRK